MRGTRDDGRSRLAGLPSPQTPRGVVRISFVAPALPAATRRSRRPSNGTIPCPVPTRDVSRVGPLARRRRRVEDALDVGEDQRADLPHARIAVAPRVERTPGSVEVAHLQATRAARRDDRDRTARLVEAECARVSRAEGV